MGIYFFNENHELFSAIFFFFFTFVRNFEMHIMLEDDFENI